MVHARAFSFTDDSINVEYPTTSPGTASEVLGRPITIRHSTDTGLLLFQLRYVQSTWYQELFQSSRDPLHNSSNYIWRMCHEMREWSESFPESLPLIFKDYFDLELLYSYIYCLAPSARVQSVSAYGKTLIFEYSIAYMQKVFPISKDPINTAFYTYHDALRVYFVGSQFIAVLIESQDQLLNGAIPYAPALIGSPPPPPLPSNSGADSIERSLKCVTHIRETLKTFGHRWEDSKALLTSFESQAIPLLTTLQQRSKHLTDTGRNSHSRSPPHFIPQQNFEHMGSPAADGWQSLASTYTGLDSGSPTRGL